MEVLFWVFLVMNHIFAAARKQREMKAARVVSSSACSAADSIPRAQRGGKTRDSRGLKAEAAGEQLTVAFSEHLGELKWNGAPRLEQKYFHAGPFPGAL